MIKFGPSGNSLSFYALGYDKTEQAAAFVRERGLDCFEYSFGRGVKMSDEKADSIQKAFEKEGIELSVHAPYFINLASVEEEKVENSYRYILDSAIMAKKMGAKRVVFHPAAQGKMTREQAVQRTLEKTKILTGLIYENGLEDIIFCPETMGKTAQIGTVEEVAAIAKIDPVYVPCVDFGHVNAREQGSLKTTEDYEKRLTFLIEELGYERMKHFHVHFSKIMYGAKGEIKHLTFADEKYGPEFAPLVPALKKLALEPYLVSESNGMQVEEAKIMKEIYLSD